MDNGNEPTLRDLITLLRRGLLLAIVAAVVASGATYLLIRGVPPTYEARATLIVTALDPNQRDFGVTLVTAPALDVATYQAAIRSRTVLVGAWTIARGSSPTSEEVEILQGSLVLSAEDARTSSVIRVRVRDHDPASARDLANAVAAAAVSWDEHRATRSLETIIEALEAQIVAIDTELAASAADIPVEGFQRNRTELQLQLSSARALRSAAVGRLEMMEGAELPRRPVAPRPMRNAALAGLVALLLVYGYLMLRGALDNRVRSPEELARVTDLPVLAEFPRVATGRRGLPLEGASYLRTAVAFAANRAKTTVILVTSAASMHGKSSVSIALAESFARQHFRTLLIDADLRKPVLGREYGLKAGENSSLRDALTHDSDPAPARVRIAQGIEMDVIPSFEAVPNPSELLANHIRPLLERSTPLYDVILIDSAPVLPVADALTIAPHVTGVVFAVSVPDADRRQVVNAVTLLRRMGVRIFGTVATNLPPRYLMKGGAPDASAYGYGYGYGSTKAEVGVDG